MARCSSASSRVEVSARVMSSYEHKIAREELRELQDKLSEMRQIAGRFDLPSAT